MGRATPLGLACLVTTRVVDAVRDVGRRCDDVRFDEVVAVFLGLGLGDLCVGAAFRVVEEDDFFAAIVDDFLVLVVVDVVRDFALVVEVDFLVDCVVRRFTVVDFEADDNRSGSIHKICCSFSSM